MSVLEKARNAFERVKAMRNGHAEVGPAKVRNRDISDLSDKRLPGHDAAGGYVAPGFEDVWNPFAEEQP